MAAYVRGDMRMKGFSRVCEGGVERSEKEKEERGGLWWCRLVRCRLRLVRLRLRGKVEF